MEEGDSSIGDNAIKNAKIIGVSANTLEMIILMSALELWVVPMATIFFVTIYWTIGLLH